MLWSESYLKSKLVFAALLSAKDKGGDTPLHLACKNNRIEVAQKLLQIFKEEDIRERSVT